MKRNDMLKWLVQNVRDWPGGNRVPMTQPVLPFGCGWDWSKRENYGWCVATAGEAPIFKTDWIIVSGRRYAADLPVENVSSTQMKELAELLKCEPNMVFAKVVEMMPDWNNIPIRAGDTPLQLFWCGPTGAKYPTGVFLDRPKGGPNAEEVKDLLERYDRKALLEALKK